MGEKGKEAGAGAARGRACPVAAVAGLGAPFGPAVPATRAGCGGVGQRTPSRPGGPRLLRGSAESAPPGLPVSSVRGSRPGLGPARVLEAPQVEPGAGGPGRGVSGSWNVRGVGRLRGFQSSVCFGQQTREISLIAFSHEPSGKPWELRVSSSRAWGSTWVARGL